jgi:hypothetical protein
MLFIQLPIKHWRNIAWRMCLCVFVRCLGEEFKSLWVSMVPLWSKPKPKASNETTWDHESCCFYGSQAIDKAAHEHNRLGLTWYLWETHLHLVTAKVPTAQLSKKIGFIWFCKWPVQLFWIQWKIPACYLTLPIISLISISFPLPLSFFI